MFTSIKKLRASSAMQSRVTTVENWLKRQMGTAYTPETKFPIAFIAHSNSVEDVSWVNGSAGTHEAWPELQAEILKAFGHKTPSEHRSAVYEMLDARSPGKTKVLTETIVPKYNAAFAAIPKVADFGTPGWPFKIEPAAATAQAETPKAEPQVPESAKTGEEPKPAAVVPTAQSESPETVAPETNEEGMYSVTVLGAMYVGLGKVMMSREKTFEEAVTYSLTPTGGRLFSEHVHAFASGAELKDVRACLKTFASHLA